MTPVLHFISICQKLRFIEAFAQYTEAQSPPGSGSKTNSLTPTLKKTTGYLSPQCPFSTIFQGSIPDTSSADTALFAASKTIQSINCHGSSTTASNAKPPTLSVYVTIQNGERREIPARKDSWKNS
jgi:hypothetical protein